MGASRCHNLLELETLRMVEVCGVLEIKFTSSRAGPVGRNFPEVTGQGAKQESGVGHTARPDARGGVVPDHTAFILSSYRKA